MKKILTGIATVGTVITMLPLFAAFEAHVVNVTATIENALSVPVEPITFGTVFPQEQLDRPLSVTLSGSFLTENRVDDVEYIIRQKPKCGVTSDNGTVLVGPTWTGHVIIDASSTAGYHIDCDLDKPKDLQIGTDQTAGLLPSLCQYLSKHPDRVNDQGGPSTNDGFLNSFHQPFTISSGTIVWNDVKGRLAKSDNDTSDKWNIDLKVPCFGGFCAQDWADFVKGINPNADPSQYTQPIANEHKVFGCNLWVEVTGVSRFID